VNSQLVNADDFRGNSLKLRLCQWYGAIPPKQQNIQ
jgi:hypothetical protein